MVFPLPATWSTAHRRRARKAGAVLAGVLLASSLSSCGSGDGGRVTITFFQFKGGGAGLLQDARASSSRRRTRTSGSSSTTRRTPRPPCAPGWSRTTCPDVMTLNANGTFGEFATAKIFRDFSDDPVLDERQPGLREGASGDLGRGGQGEVNGVPFAANASGLLYNEQLFAKYDVAVPKTFDELIAAAKKFKAARRHALLRDARRRLDAAVPAGAAVGPAAAGRLLPEALQGQDDLRAGLAAAPPPSSPSCTSTPSPTRCRRATRTAPPPSPRGESAMLLLGSYAVPQIRLGKPAFTVGSMALPATDDPSQDDPGLRRRRGDHGLPGTVHTRRRQMKFIDFLMQPKVMNDYCKAQVAIPTLERPDERRPRAGGRPDVHRLRADRGFHRPPVHPGHPARAAAADLPAQTATSRHSSTTSTTTGTGCANAGPGDWEQ